MQKIMSIKTHLMNIVKVAIYCCGVLIQELTVYEKNSTLLKTFVNNL